MNYHLCKEGVRINAEFISFKFDLAVTNRELSTRNEFLFRAGFSFLFYSASRLSSILASYSFSCNIKGVDGIV